MRHCGLRSLIFIAGTLCPLGLAQNSNQHVYVPCNAPTNADVYCDGCGGNWIQTSTPGSSGTMDLVDPTECDSTILACQFPTASQGEYLAVTDSEFGCNGYNTGCDPTDLDLPSCPAGSTCSNPDGPGMCVQNQKGPDGDCTLTGNTGRVPGTLSDCCGAATCVTGFGVAQGTCVAVSLPCGSATDPNCATAACNASTGQWDESSCGCNGDDNNCPGGLVCLVNNACGCSDICDDPVCDTNGNFSCDCQGMNCPPPGGGGGGGGGGSGSGCDNYSDPCCGSGSCAGDWEDCSSASCCGGDFCDAADVCEPPSGGGGGSCGGVGAGCSTSSDCCDGECCVYGNVCSNEC